METSTNESAAQQAFLSPPRRRRSTFFERRDSFAPQPLSENIDPNVCSSNMPDKPNTVDLSSYYNRLLEEKEMWKREVNTRRNKYHDLRQQYQITAKSSVKSRVSYASLSNEDIAFLKAKPNITILVEGQQKLHKSVKETHALFRRVNELDNVILSYSEDKVNVITQHILDNSTV